MNVMDYQAHDVIEDLFKAIENQDMALAQQCLTGNFSSVLLKKNVTGKEFLDMYCRIKEGLPDARFTIENLTTDGASFKANVKITGTHSKTIPSLRKGWHAMKATRKKVNSIITTVEIILRGHQIMEIRNTEKDYGVISGLLRQLQLLPKSYPNI